MTFVLSTPCFSANAIDSAIDSIDVAIKKFPHNLTMLEAPTSSPKSMHLPIDDNKFVAKSFPSFDPAITHVACLLANPSGLAKTGDAINVEFNLLKSLANCLLVVGEMVLQLI